MDLVLCGLTYTTCVVYLDDIIEYATDFETHLSRLREVVDRLRAAKLKLHRSKCTFVQHRVDFLGHVLSNRGVEVQEEKIACVRYWPVPQNLAELRAFLGLCGYYRLFVDNFACIATPLYKLHRKEAALVWEQSQQHAFDTLKQRLISAPVLSMPMDGACYYLDCDASGTGLGVVLSQDHDGVEVVIAYASRTLTQPEQNYDVTHRELLPVVFGLQTFRQYLLGRHFVLRIDHAALKWLRRTPEPMGQLARWLILMEEYDFDVQHRAGTKHGNADGLSRRPATADSGEAALVRVAVVSSDAVVDATVVAEQQEAAREHLGDVRDSAGESSISAG